MAPEDIIIRGQNNSSLTIKTDLVDISVNASSLGVDFGGNIELGGSDVTHAALDIAGIFDPTGAADIANGFLYAAEGKKGDALISGLGVFPLIGDLAKVNRIGNAIETIDNAVDVALSAKQIKNLRQSAVRKAWKEEKELVESGARPTREWTKVELKELKANGKIKGYKGHHINNVKHHPELAGNPNNVEFVNSKEHLQRHSGNYRNKTTGEMKNRSNN